MPDTADSSWFQPVQTGSGWFQTVPGGSRGSRQFQAVPAGSRQFQGSHQWAQLSPSVKLVVLLGI